MSDYDAGDRYRVDTTADGFLVRHYPDPETRRPCCKIAVRVTDADRAQAIPDADPHGKAAALRRVYLAIERKHGRGPIVDNNAAVV